MVVIPISVFYKEDLNKDFPVRVRKPEFASVKRPTLDQVQPATISGATFAAEAVFGNRKLQIAVTLTDADDARLNFFVANENLSSFKGKEGTYTLMMTKNGIDKKLWGGPFTVTEQ